MKQFIYNVNGIKFADTEAFGEAWKQAKVKAIELHCPIFREVINGDRVKRQVYYTGGLFNSIEFMREDNVKVF